MSNSKKIIFLCSVDWANVSTIVAHNMNEYSKKYDVTVVCYQAHQFRYSFPHEMNWKQSSLSDQNNVVQKIKDCDLIVYCHEPPGRTQNDVVSYIPDLKNIIKDKKKITYHASTWFNNKFEDPIYEYQLFVPEIYHLGIQGKGKLIIPSCPLSIPENIYEIIENKKKEKKIRIYHACSKPGNSKGTATIIQQVQKILKKYEHVEFINIPFRNRRHSEILKTKLKTDIYIDQYNNHIGGFGVSSLESLNHGCIVLCSINKVPKDINSICGFTRDIPIIDISGEVSNIFLQLDRLCNSSKDDLADMMYDNIKWIKDNLTAEPYLKYYEEKILDPLFL